MSKSVKPQQILDEIKAKNAARAKRFKERREAAGLVRVSVWIPSKLKQYVDSKGYQYVVGYSNVATEQIPVCLDGKWQVSPKCA